VHDAIHLCTSDSLASLCHPGKDGLNAAPSGPIDRDPGGHLNVVGGRRWNNRICRRWLERPRGARGLRWNRGVEQVWHTASRQHGRQEHEQDKPRLVSFHHSPLRQVTWGMPSRRVPECDGSHECGTVVSRLARLYHRSKQRPKMSQNSRDRKNEV
jgi:hypothetical protein